MQLHEIYCPIYLNIYIISYAYLNDYLHTYSYEFKGVGTLHLGSSQEIMIAVKCIKITCHDEVTRFSQETITAL